MRAAERYKAVRRLAAVQEQLHRLAEWKLAVVRLDAAALEARQVGLMKLLDGDAGISPVFAVAAMKQLHAIAAARAAVRQREENAETQVRAAAQRVGSAENLAAAAKVEAQRDEERRALAETIDLLAQRNPASLP